VKRHLDLCRDILLATEDLHSWENKHPGATENLRHKWSQKQIDYHIYLLQDAGYLLQIDNEILPRLTWKAHEDLEYLRDDVKWQTLMDAEKEVGGIPWFVAITYMQGDRLTTVNVEKERW
jgi:hypothetical protein